MQLKKVLALVLIFCLLLSAVPVWAANGEPAQSVEETSVVSQTEQSQTTTQEELATPDTSAEVTVVREEESLRGEYEKHFLMSDGSYQAVVYSYPVHELVNGVWVELPIPEQTARGEVSPGNAQQNIIDNYVWQNHGVQDNNSVRLYIGKRSGNECRAFIRFATMPTIPAGATITAATMKVNMVSGTSTANNAAAYQVAGSWESGTIQWSNMPVTNTLLADNISHNNKTKYEFSCLAAVQHWYDGSTTGQNENYGIMLKYADDTVADYNSFYSADCTDATMRPSMTISYQLMVVPMNQISVQEGYLAQLPLPSITGTITWTSSNESVATVNSNGVVTGVKAGRVTITASVEDVAEYTYTVYVKIKEGAHRIYRANASYYLSVGGGMLENAGIYLKNASDADLPLYRQVWRIIYLEQGYYVIRPLHNQNMALYAKDGECGVTTIGNDNYLIKVPEENRWTIEWLNGGYVFKCQGDSAQTLRSLYNAPEVQVYTGEYMAANNVFQWQFADSPDIEPEVLLLNSKTGETINDSFFVIMQGQTTTPEELDITATFVCLCSSTHDLTWSSSAPSIVTIDSTTGTMNGVASNGVAVISVKHSNNNITYSKSVLAAVGAVPSGIYYIKSRVFDKYIQISNSSAPSYTQAHAIMEHWDFDGEECQKWIIALQSTGYYAIISPKSGLALTVRTGADGEADALVEQAAYTGSFRQQWLIIPTSNGGYKIKARSSVGLSTDYAMSIDYTMVDNVNGTYMAQREYTADTNYRDEWNLYTVGTDVFLLGVNASEAGHDHHTAYGSVMPTAQKLGYDGFNCVITDGISVEDTLDYMQQCKIFVSRGHAGATNYETAICLNKNSNEQSEFLYSSNIYSYFEGCRYVDMSGCDLALFVGCSTAAVEGNSLPDAAVAAGATYAIGFEKSIDCDEANVWTQYFFKYYLEGNTVARSAELAADKCGGESATQSVRVVG